jgi:hypothetical protein
VPTHHFSSKIPGLVIGSHLANVDYARSARGPNLEEFGERFWATASLCNEVSEMHVC